MEELKTPLKYLLGPVFALVIVWSFLVPDAALFQRPELARIFFWHFPCPIMLTGFLFYGSYCCLRYFLRFGPTLQAETDQKVRAGWDIRATSALELGMVFAVLTMISGMLFSLAQWGALWQWDPRQTSFLVALIFYGAYFALRTAIQDPETRATNSAAFMLTATLPLLFLIYVFPRLPQILAVSFHPTDTIMTGKLKDGYLYVTLCILALTTCVSVWIYRLRVAVGLIELENTYGQLETVGGHSAPTIVVRPVRLPPEGRPEGGQAS